MDFALTEFQIFDLKNNILPFVIITIFLLNKYWITASAIEIKAKYIMLQKCIYSFNFVSNQFLRNPYQVYCYRYI